MNTGYTPETISAYAQRMARHAAQRRVKLARRLRRAGVAVRHGTSYGDLLRACRERGA